MSRILGLINSCGGCDHRKYNSGNVYNCDLVDLPIRNKERIASFCPLPKYPDWEIASLEAVIDLLRKPNEHSFERVIMAFLVDKLKTTISPDGRYITILIGKEKYLQLFSTTQFLKLIYEKERLFLLPTPHHKKSMPFDACCKK